MAEVLRRQGVTVIALDAAYEALDQAKFERAQELLLGQAQTVEPPLLVLDLSKTSYMGSAFIEVMFRSWKRINERQGRLVLCGVQPFCAEVLRTTRLDTLVDHYVTVEDAVAALKAQ
jgi:anti-sigma B factor antagonist